jgi:hypothetical protein
MHRLAALVLLPPVVLGLGCAPSKPASAPAPSKAVSISLPTDTGDLVTAPVPKAKATVLDFFGPTCEPYKKSVPALVAKRPAIEAKGGKLVLVAILADGETTEQAEAALKSWGVKSPFLVDAHDVCRKELGFKGIPATYVLDHAGAVVWAAPAAATADDVVNAVP